MNFFPLIHRELLVASRRTVTWWTRVGIGLVGALGFLLVAGTASLGIRQPAQVGPALFTTLSVAAFLLAALSGIRSAALPLCEENRERTLGLLLLTPLRRHDLVLGRLAAGILEGLGALAAFLPVLALVLLAGGVTAGQLAMSAVTLIVMVLLSTAAGLYAGAMNTRDLKASLLTLLLVLVACLPTGWIALAIMMTAELDAQAQREFAFGRPATRSNGLLLPAFWLPLIALFLFSLLLAPSTSLGSFASPAGMLLLGLSDGSPVLFGLQTAGALCLALALTWLTSRRLAVIHVGVSENHDPEPSVPAPPIASGIDADDNLTDAQGAAPVPPPPSRPRWLLEQSPILWLLHPRAGTRRFIWFAAVMMSISAFFPIFASIDEDSVALSFGGFMLPGALVWPVVNFIVAWQAARLFVESRRTRNLELLLVTPGFRKSSIRDVWRSLRTTFLKPVLLVGLVGLAGTVVAINAMPDERTDLFEPAWGLPVYLLTASRHLAGLVAVVWLSLWLGWSCRRPGLAASQAFVLAYLLPTILFLPFAEVASTWTAKAMIPHLGGIVLSIGIAVGARLALSRALPTGQTPEEIRRK